MSWENSIISSIDDNEQKQDLVQIKSDNFIQFPEKRLSNYYMMRSVLVSWFDVVKRKKRLKIITDAIKKRHEFYIKYKALNTFEQNAQIYKRLQIYSYIKIQEKPSLALYFLSIMRKNDLNEYLSHTFHAWIVYIRRRRHWHQFVFENISQAEYEPAKRKVLSQLQHKNISSNLTPTQWMSKNFIKKSLNMHHQIMTGQNEGSNMFLLCNDSKESNEIQQKENESIFLKQIRKVFFAAWKSMSPDFSLFLRVVTIYSIKKISESCVVELNIKEKISQHYKDVISFFVKNKIASNSKLNQALKLIQENNQKALTNRNLLSQRDHFIFNSIDTKLSSNFNHKLTTSDKLIKLNQNINSSFKVLIPILQYLSLNPIPNESNFASSQKCKTEIPDFSKTILNIHEIIKSDQKRFQEILQSSENHILIPNSTEQIDNNNNENDINNSIIPQIQSENLQDQQLSIDTKSNKNHQEKIDKKLTVNPNKFSESQNALLTIQNQINSAAPLNPGFSDVVMRSVGILGDVDDSHITEKYKIYLEMLFGQQQRDESKFFAKAMRDKLVDDFESRKQSHATAGLDTRSNQLPISPAIEKYREERMMKSKFQLEKPKEDSALKRKLALYDVLFTGKEEEEESSDCSDENSENEEERNEIDNQKEVKNKNEENDNEICINENIKLKSQNEMKVKISNKNEQEIRENENNLKISIENEQENSENENEVKIDNNDEENNHKDEVKERNNHANENKVKCGNDNDEEQDTSDNTKKLNEFEFHSSENSKATENLPDPAHRNAKSIDSIGETCFQKSENPFNRSGISSSNFSSFNKIVFHIFEKCAPQKIEEEEDVLHIDVESEEFSATQEESKAETNLNKPDSNFYKKKLKFHSIKGKPPNRQSKHPSPLSGLLYTEKVKLNQKANLAKFSPPNPAYKIAKPSVHSSLDDSKVVTFAGGGRGVVSRKPESFAKVRIANSRRHSSSLSPLLKISESSEKVSGTNQRFCAVKSDGNALGGMGSIIISHYHSACEDAGSRTKFDLKTAKMAKK